MSTLCCIPNRNDNQNLLHFTYTWDKKKIEFQTADFEEKKKN